MPFDSDSTLQQTDDTAAVASVGGASTGGGGGGVSEWDDLTSELSGPVPFDATDEDGNPTSRSIQFLNVQPQVDVTSDPANGIALEIKDQTNGNRLGTLTTDGRWETRADQEAFADGSFPSGSSTNSLLQVEDAGTVLTTDAASLNFTGSGLSLTQNGDEITVDVSGGSGSDIDIESNQSTVVGGATGLSFEGSGIDDVTNDGDGTATVTISKGSSTEVQEGGTAQVSDVTTLDFVGGDFSVANPTSGEAEVGLQDDTVTVAGNAVSLGGSTGIAHGDLSSIGSDDHHTKTTSAADLTDVSADSVTDAHHARPSAGDGLSESSNTFSVNEAQVDHDSLSQFVANEHVDHSDVTISAGTALSGGGDLTAPRTLNVAGPLTGVPFKESGDNLEWQADANNDLILQNTTDAQTLLKVDQDTGTVFAAGDVVAFGLSGGGGSGSTSGLQADAPLTLDPTTDPDTIGLSVGSGLTVTNGTLEATGSTGVSSVFGRTGDVTAQSGDYAHSQISGVSSDDHHTRYSDEEAQDAVGTIMTGSGAAAVTYDDARNTITISATDTNTQLSESEVQTAINNDADHGSTASHNYFTAGEARSAVEGTSDVADLVGGLGTSGQVPQTDGTNVSWVTLAASDISGVSPDSDPDAHHAVFEPADYNPVSDVEAHPDALAIDITGDADTLDGYEGNDLAALAEDETVTGLYTFKNSNFTQPSSGITAATVHSPGVATNTRYGLIATSSRSLANANAVSLGMYYDVGDGTASGAKEAGLRADARANGDNTAITLGGLVFKKQAGSNNSTATLNIRGGDSLTVAPGGVGIGTLSPSYALEVSGDVRSTGEIEAFLGSDRRLKTRLDPLDSALDKVDQLTGYGFDWREAGGVQPHKRGQGDVGLIAQEVEDVLPEAVESFTGGHSEGYKGVSYDKVVPLLVEAIKDLRSQVEQLQ